MDKICMKADPERIGAVYVLGLLVIWAEGRKPAPCYEVRVERSPLRIYPPQYQVTECVESGVICPRVITPYRAAGLFAVSRETFEAMNGVAVIHVEGGPREVPVRVIEIPNDQLEGLGVASAAGGDVPFPFGPEGGVAPFPLGLSDLFDGGGGGAPRLLTRADVGLHTATGYSDSFSFTEAFQDAVGNLPPDTNPFPDKLTNVRVVGVGAQYGGIVGLRRMYVTVASFY